MDVYGVYGSQSHPNCTAVYNHVQKALLSNLLAHVTRLAVCRTSKSPTCEAAVWSYQCLKKCIFYEAQRRATQISLTPQSKWIPFSIKIKKSWAEDVVVMWSYKVMVVWLFPPPIVEISLQCYVVRTLQVTVDSKPQSAFYEWVVDCRCSVV